MTAPDRSRAAQARHSLLRWYQRRSRALPWRQSRSPYRVWVSEVMLQQTQIETVIPYYERFLAEFPTIRKLAGAPLERVLELWSGLGYYRRARYLQRAAQEMVQSHDGQFPNDLKQACSLPGIGNYTARAVLSIAYGQPFAVLDGNVARVMARFLALSGSIAQPGLRQAVEENLELFLSRRSPGNFNQALMELGQTVCLPRSPRCPHCPLRRWCRAFESNRQEDYPEPRPRRQAETWHMATAVLCRNEQVLLMRGLEPGLLDGLWNFPAAMGRSSAEARALLQEKIGSALGAKLELKQAEHQLQHNITYRSIKVRVYSAEYEGKTSGKDFRWFQPSAIDHAAVSQLARKIARRLASTSGDSR